MESQQLSVADCASEVNAVELISWGCIALLSDRRPYRRMFANPGRIHTSEKSPSWTSASSGVQIRRIEEILSDKASRLVGHELEADFGGVRGCTSTCRPFGTAERTNGGAEQMPRRRLLNLMRAPTGPRGRGGQPVLLPRATLPAGYFVAQCPAHDGRLIRRRLQFAIRSRSRSRGHC